MKKIGKILLKILSCFLGFGLFLGGIGGIIVCFYAKNIYTVIFCIIFSSLFLFGGVSLLRIGIRKTEADKTPKKTRENQDFNSYQENQPTVIEKKMDISNSEERPIAYIETGNIIQRVDEKPITDEEIPYLIQLGYEKTMQSLGKQNIPMLDLSFMQEKDKNKKEYTKIPTYEELLNIENTTDTVRFPELLFLNYLNGLPLKNPLIAQKWYYDYNLNYTKTIKNLIANGLLTVEYASIDRLNSSELKNILRKFNYPSSGKKADLRARIYENISQNDIDSYFNNAKYFSTTPKGKELIKRNNINC